MSEEWQYQVRIELPLAAAELARRDPEASELRPLAAILARHRNADLPVRHSRASLLKPSGKLSILPSCRWTKKTIEDPAKKAISASVHFLYRGSVYPKAQAAALVADLQPLVNEGLITRIAQYDTNPANNPQPPARSAT